MTKLSTLLRFGLALTLCATVAVAQEEAPQSEDKEATEPTAGAIEDVIVVTASRTEQKLHDVPAAVTVISADQIETAPADNYGDLLRNVPGLNVSQMSARDIQVTARGATSSLATSQLVLVDGRTIYLDFFGFVMWDYLPVNMREVKQIESVQGPGSAVWGANAMTGVINVITKSPREMLGTSVMLGGGELGTAYGSISHAGVGGKVGYKLSASYFQQDPYPRPTGVIPGTGTPYPPFKNQGTAQPKVDVRLDYDSTPGTTWSYSAGYAATDGIIHSGIGPFDIDKGSGLSYAKANWSHQAMRASLFTNILRGDAKNLLTVGTDGRPLDLGFDSETYNLDFTNTSVVGQKNVLTYGANARKNQFDLTIAPQGTNRDEIGAFLQDEILFGSQFHWLLGARWDNIDPIGTVVSPRTSLLYSPTPNHTFRVSYNRAFRAPSLINNYLDITIVNQALIDPSLIAAAIAPGIPCQFVLSTCTPFVLTFPSAALGNPDLQEERLDAVEAGYVGSFAHNTTFTLSVYRNKQTDSADFFTQGYYSPTNPPPGWPVFLLGPLPIPVVPPGTFPSAFSYRNVGEIIDKGVEVSLMSRPGTGWSWFANYSYQAKPEVTGISIDETNLPPKNRFNLGAAFSGDRFFANGNVNYQDKARWTDVLDARFFGTTDSFTAVNLTLGVRLANDRTRFSVIGTNIFDDRVQQHIFGDIISRKVVGQLDFEF
jgi:outer membrane receptor protein involved in Fe transport